MKKTLLSTIAALSLTFGLSGCNLFSTTENAETEVTPEVNLNHTNYISGLHIQYNSYQLLYSDDKGKILTMSGNLDASPNFNGGPISIQKDLPNNSRPYLITKEGEMLPIAHTSSNSTYKTFSNGSFALQLDEEQQ